MSEDALIVFLPSGKRGRFAKGTLVLEAARALGVDIDSVCGGRGLCGRCQVEAATGDFAKHAISSSPDSLSPVNAEENRFANTRKLDSSRRLGCQARFNHDVVIDVPPESQVHRQVVRKQAEARDIILDADIHLYYLERSRDLLQALEEQWQLKGLEIDPCLKLIKGDITVAVRDGKTVIALWPGFHDASYGLAIDVGSTTIAAHLCHLSTGSVVQSAGMMNPQIRFGEDLMSRVSYAMMNPGGAEEMTGAVRKALRDLAKETADQAGIDVTDILSATLVGNPVMHHLVLGLDPIPLGQAPFPLGVEGAVTRPARDIGLGINPGAQVYLPPCIAGHVGADTAAVILSEAPYDKDEMILLVDVGTNAEIVLGNKNKLLACSSPTGPAFEGAQITSGQRAAPGAIERVRIDPVTLEPRFKVIGCDAWSDEPEFDATVTGICGSGIIEVIAEMFLAGIVTVDGIIDGSMAEKNRRVSADGRTFSYLLHEGEPNVVVTQTDIRAIQLAKGALYASARLLMDRLGIATVDRIRLAGAFGSHIDVKYAMVLGLIPDCDLAHVTSIGNAAGTGARIALLNKAARREIEEVVARVEKVETALEPAFQQHFVDAMAFPHKTALYPNLEKVVSLPDKKIPSQSQSSRRRRRK